MKKLYQELAMLVCAYHNCERTKNIEWEDKHYERILWLVGNRMPSGSGIDNGTKIDLEKSTGEVLSFTFGYHHMNEHGMYDGWTQHTCTVRGSLQDGFRIGIGGRDRNGVKEYLYDTYHYALSQEVPPREPEVA